VSVPIRRSVVALAIAGTLLIGGCGGSSEDGAELTVYLSAPLSGPRAAEGRDAADAARENVGTAFGVASQAEGAIGAEAASALRAAVQGAFVDGLRVGLLVAAGLVAIAGAVVVRRLPPHTPPA